MACHHFQPSAVLSGGVDRWSTDIVAREIQDHVQGFSANLQILTGYIAGETCLPLPPIVDENVPERTSGQRDDFLMRNKERVHAMESCLITWTKQIRSVLQMDPESSLGKQSHPLPVDEIDFWFRKAKNLNSIFHQLQGDRVRNVLQYLEFAKHP